ncbi:MAG: PHP domain-containing protein [Chloroflexota bacterium]
MKPENWLRVDFHVHTVYSSDGLITPEKLIAICKERGLDRVAVTDHNTIRGAQIAKALAPETIIIGEEIMTTRGELLAFFVQEEIPPGLVPEAAIQRLRAQGAFISVSHPFDNLRPSSWQRGKLQPISTLVDAIEVFNARCLLASFNQKSHQFAQEHGLLATVGSDAHTTYEIGKVILTLPFFHDTESLRRALPQGQAHTRRSGLLVRTLSLYARLLKKF